MLEYDGVDVYKAIDKKRPHCFVQMYYLSLLVFS